jgi:hypothetical protein
VRIILVTFGLVALLACSCDFSGHIPQPVTLNADEYRQEITDIDRLVFSPKAYDEARRSELASKLQGLASRITAGSDSRFLKMEAGEIRTIAHLAQHTSVNAPESTARKLDAHPQ